MFVLNFQYLHSRKHLNLKFSRLNNVWMFCSFIAQKKLINILRRGYFLIVLHLMKSFPFILLRPGRGGGKWEWRILPALALELITVF